MSQMKPRLPTLGRIALFVLAVAACGGWARSARADELTTVRIGVIPSMTETPFYIADKLGYFRAEGIDVKFVRFDSAANMVAPLGTGQLDVGGGALSAGLYNAVGRGIDVRVVADLGSDPPGYGFVGLLVRSDLVTSGRFKTIKDLKGMTVAISAPGVSTGPTLDELLKKAGLTFSDVKMTYMGNPEQIVSFKNGGLDASIMPEPNVSQAARSGVAVKIAADDSWYPNQETSVVFYGINFLKTRRDVGLRFMRAYLRGVRYYNETLRNGKLAGPNADLVVKILVAETGIADPALFRSLTPNGNNPNGQFNLVSMNQDFAFYKQLGLIEGTVTPEAAIDPAFVTAALRALGPYKPSRN
jgi:NitT/TauT family transport system substrate-binding protein